MKPRSVIVGLTLAFAMVATSLSAQERRPLDHPDYDVWNRIDGERLASGPPAPPWPRSPSAARHPCFPRPWQRLPPHPTARR